MTTGFHGKVQRTYWISKAAGEKLRRLVKARGGRCGGQVSEEAINLLYKLDPLMAGQPPIPDDEIAVAPKSVPKNEVDDMLDTAANVRLGRL